MIIQFSKIFIPYWIIIALILMIPSWFLSRWGSEKSLLKFLMIWSFSNFAWIQTYMIFSRDPFAGFMIFHNLGFFLLFLLFYWLWKKKKNNHHKF